MIRQNDIVRKWPLVFLLVWGLILWSTHIHSHANIYVYVLGRKERKFSGIS